MAIYGQLTVPTIPLGTTYDVTDNLQHANIVATFYLNGVALAIYPSTTQNGTNALTVWGSQYVALKPGTQNPPFTIKGGGIQIDLMEIAIRLIIIPAGDYTISAGWPAAMQGVKTSRYNVTLPLPQNTATLDATQLTAAGANFTSASGTPGNPTVYNNMFFSRGVKAQNLHDITFINCLFDAGRRANSGATAPTTKGDSFCINTTGATDIRIEHCELCNAADELITGDGFALVNCCLHHSGADLIKAGNNCVVYGNYGSYTGFANPCSHADGVQSQDVGNVLVRYNFFDLNFPPPVGNCTVNPTAFKANSIAQVETAPVGQPPGQGNYNYVIRNNWLRSAPGTNGLHVFNPKAGLDSTIQILDNLMLGTTITASAGAVVSGNVDQNGNAVP